MEKYYLKKPIILKKKDYKNKEQKKTVQKDKYNKSNKKYNKQGKLIQKVYNKTFKRNMKEIKIFMIGVMIEIKYKQQSIGLNFKQNKRKLINLF